MRTSSWNHQTSSRSEVDQIKVSRYIKLTGVCIVNIFEQSPQYNQSKTTLTKLDNNKLNNYDNKNYDDK